MFDPYSETVSCLPNFFSHVLKDNPATMMILSQILSFLLHVSMVKGAKFKTCFFVVVVVVVVVAVVVFVVVITYFKAYYRILRVT